MINWVAEAVKKIREINQSGICSFVMSNVILEKCLEELEEIWTAFGDNSFLEIVEFFFWKNTSLKRLFVE